jgi:hypothetical protein
MTRLWLYPVRSFIVLTYGLAATAAFAAPGGQFKGGSGGHSRGGNFPSTRVSPAVLNNRVTGGGSFKPSTPIKPIGPSPFKPTTPRFPTGPIVGPIKPPTGPFKPPVGPLKPPTGPVVGPVKPPVKPLPPIGPIKPPKDPIVGPIKPPIGPFPPIGPVKPPKDPIVGPIKPPVGPIKPPGGGGGGGGGTGGGHGGHHKHCWPTIVLGCRPCTGTYGGVYCPPVYTTPIYTQPAVVPVATPVVVASASTETEPATSAVAVSETTSTPSDSEDAAASSTPPAEAAEKLPQVPAGSTLALQAKDLGTTKGQVLLVIDKLSLTVQIDEWAPEHTIATLPQLGITSPTKAELVVVRADGKAANSVKVELIAAQAESTTGLAAVTR